MGTDTADPGAGDGSERRREERIPARVEIRFTEASQAAKALRAYSLNFSVNGLCLRTSRRYELGAKLNLSLGVGGEKYSLVGTVAWVRDGAIGVRFENLTDTDRVKLEALVAALRK